MKKLSLSLLEKNIDEIAAFDLENNKIFGSAYLVYQKGNLCLEKCFGTRALTGKEAITKDTLFRLASMTKPITAAAILILCERGVISLDDTITKYLPEFSDIHIINDKGTDLGKPKKLPKIKNLLTHSSGIGSDMTKYSAMTKDDLSTVDATVSYLSRAGLDFEPEETQLYSPLGAFDVAVKILEKTTGKDYFSFLKEELFIPLEMYDTTFIPTAEQRGRMVEMHQKTNGKNDVKAMPDSSVFEDIPETHFLGGGGLASTLSDYGKFSYMLLNKGISHTGKRILSENTFNAMTKSYIDICDNQAWGLGVRIITGDSYKLLPAGTFGWSGAYGTHFFVDCENQIFAVFMKNSAFDGGAGNESAINLEKAVYSSFDTV